MVTDKNLGCRGRKEQKRADNIVTGPLPDPFLKSLKQGIYAGLVNEISRIGALAAQELERNIKMVATRVALDLSEDVSVSSYKKGITIEIKLDEDSLQKIVSDTLARFNQ